MRSSSSGPERYVLAIALVVPLLFGMLAMVHAPVASLASPVGVLGVEAGPSIVSKRPVSTNLAPPPTLVAPTPTPPARPPGAERLSTPETRAPVTYVVQPGDELKHVAANYGVSIWKIIETNQIPDPDSLRIGQVLRIPER